MPRYEERALLRGLEKKIFNFVRKRATPEQWGEWLRAPLEHAAAAGDAELVGKMLRAGANVGGDWRGCEGRTLLCAAVEGGNDNIVSSLLKAGAKKDVNVRCGEREWSPLHYAALGGHETIARMLMMAGAYADDTKGMSCTPLNLAVRGGYERLAVDLLIRGAPPNARDRTGQTPLHLAAKKGLDQILSTLLLRGADIDMVDTRKSTPLHLAARHGHLSAAKSLLEAGADTYMRNISNCEALDMAAREGHDDVLRALIQHGAPVSPAGGMTALHWAALRNHVRATEVLIDSGADVLASTSGDGQPLHSAAKGGSCDAIRVLLQHKAEVDGQSRVLQTPLMLACMHVAERAADLLLRSGADEARVDSVGRSALQLIGMGLTERKRQRRAVDVERMRGLLVHAPADRAWRRRGFLTMCRAFPHKVGLGYLDENEAGKKAAYRDLLSACGPNTCGKAAKCGVLRAGNGDGEGDGASRGSARGEGTGKAVAGHANSVETMVVLVDSACVFRCIVSFL